MKYEYNGRIYNMDKFICIEKGGYSIVDNKWRALGVRSFKGNPWFNIGFSGSNVIFDFNNEDDYNNFLNDYKKS